jgi:hypothetical protein
MIENCLIQSGRLAIATLKHEPKDYAQLAAWLSDPRALSAVTRPAASANSNACRPMRVTKAGRETAG